MFLKRIFNRRKPNKNFITVVSGLPRSGTSMMMQILEAGGIPPVTDNIRQSDSDNVKGYYEHEAVKQLEYKNYDCLLEAEGRAIKIISALLNSLPNSKKYKIIFMCRDIEEILASQKKMLMNLGSDSKQNIDQQLKRLYTRDLAKTRSWLLRQNHIDVLYIDYADVIERPKGQVTVINDFLGVKLNIKRMLSVVDQSMRNHDVKDSLGT